MDFRHGGGSQAEVDLAHRVGSRACANKEGIFP